MQQQVSYKQAHAWSGKVLTTVHIGQNSASLLGTAGRLQTTTRQLPPGVFRFLLLTQSHHIQTQRRNSTKM